MAKADVLTLVDTLSLGVADQTTVSSSYSEVLRAFASLEWFVAAQAVEHATDAPEYLAPDDALALLALAYDDRWLSHEMLETLEATNPSWRAVRGLPIAYVAEAVGDRRYRLFPAPDTADVVPDTQMGQPFGVSFYVGQITAVYTHDLSTVPTWCELPLACFLLAREFARDSEHRTPELATAWQALGEALIAYVADGPVPEALRRQEPGRAA